MSIIVYTILGTLVVFLLALAISYGFAAVFTQRAENGHLNPEVDSRWIVFLLVGTAALYPVFARSVRAIKLSEIVDTFLISSVTLIVAWLFIQNRRGPKPRGTNLMRADHKAEDGGS